MKHRLLGLILLSIFVSGCDTNSEIRLAQARYACEVHQGLHHVDNFTGANCCDSTVISHSSLSSVVLPPNQTHKYYGQLNLEAEPCVK